MREYENKKLEVSSKSARYLQELDSVNREQKADQDLLDNEINKKSYIENKHRQKGYEKAEAMKRVDYLNEQIK